VATTGPKNNIGKDDKGRNDDSWWGSSSKPNEQGGQHNTLYAKDGGRYSYDTDSKGGYVEGQAMVVASTQVSTKTKASSLTVPPTKAGALRLAILSRLIILLIVPGKQGADPL